MRQTFPFGRIAGIRVGANWSALVILLLIVDLLATSALPAAVPRQPEALYWGVGVAAAMAFLASLLAHELSHALVARRNGIRVRSVTLFMLGGVTELEGDPGTPGADLRIAVAGPATSLLAGVFFLGVAAAIGYAGGPRVATAAATWLALMNAVLAVFNLLPGAPLDGGRVLRALLWRRSGDRNRAEQSAAGAGRVIGAGLAALGVAVFLLTGELIDGLWLVLIGWFMISLAVAEQSAATARALLAGVRVADVMIPDPDLAAGWLSVAEFAWQLGRRSAQTAFPVVAADGALLGVVSVMKLAKVPAGRRDQVRLSELAVPVPAEYLAAPGDPVAPLLTRDPLAGEVVAVVRTDGAITGLVTAENLRQALRWRRLAGTASYVPSSPSG